MEQRLELRWWIEVASGQFRPEGPEVSSHARKGVDHSPEIFLSAEGARQYRPFGPYGRARLDPPGCFQEILL